MFIVLVAADIFQNKTNFELAFPSRPTLLELTRQTETAFSNEISIRRPDGVPQHSFHVAKFKAYDEDRNKWVDMISESQLVDYTQLYAFQPANPWHKESPKEIPVAVKPPTSGNPSSVNGSNSAPQYRTNTSGTTAINVRSTVSIGGTGGHGLGNPTSSSAMGGGISNQRPSAGSLAIRNNVVGNMAYGGVRSLLDAGPDEKVRVVFAEFDLKGHKMLDMEDLKQGFRALGFEFTTETMNDLFQKGDLNADGRISFSEFERFAKMYPIMTDCLFYRSKAFWDEDALIREMESLREIARQAALAAQQAEALHQNAINAANTAANIILTAENDIKDYNNRLRDLAKDADHSKRERERAQKEKFDKENDLVAVKDRERQARQALADAARETDKQEKKIQSYQQEMIRADDKIKQLEAAIDDARRGGERAAQNVRSSQSEWESLKGREKDANKILDGVIRELPRLEEAFRTAEHSLQSATDHIRDLDNLARDIARDADEAARRRDANERAAREARDQEAQLAADADRAKQLADEKDRLFRIKETELLESQRQRQMVSDHERQLIEQELRLREQRETLEEKEVKLKSEAGSFLAGLRSSLATQARSYSREATTVIKDDYRRAASNY